MKKIGICVILLLAISMGQAQRGSVKVSVVNDQQTSLENATVEILKAKDSSLVKAGISDRNGLAELENVRYGGYILKVSMVNYAVQFSGGFSISAEQPNITVPKISLTPKAGQLAGVTVNARKPFIQKL